MKGKKKVETYKAYKTYKKKPNYCSVCGTPMEENRTPSEFDPITGTPKKVAVVRRCPKVTTHPIWEGEE
jgi:hypothetical protein